MPLPEQYLVTAKNLEDFFNSIINAQAPPKFTLKFLENLEFKSTNDRLFIGILKALGFIDSDSIPQQRYFDFIDQTQSKQVLAEAIEEAYSDLFAVNKNAHTLTENEIKNKFKTLLQGSKSDNVFSLMAKTFRALCEYADFSEIETQDESIARSDYQSSFNQSNNQSRNENENYEDQSREKRIVQELKAIQTQMHYNIQIHLPETRDIAVYEAIFKALKEHLL